MMRLQQPTNSKGFTVIELLVATAVFGVVLLVIATAVLQLSRLYYKGLNETRVQSTARAIVDQIAQSIQFNGGTVTTTVAAPTAGASYAFCVGNNQYSYTTGFQMADAPTSSQTYHAIVVRNLAGCTSSSPAQNVRAVSVSGRELLSTGMRLSRMEVTNIGGDSYRVSVRVLFGDSVLMNNPTAANASCREIRSGGQFCSEADITSTVTKRVK